jgi:ribosomal protein L27
VYSFYVTEPSYWGTKYNRFIRVCCLYVFQRTNKPQMRFIKHFRLYKMEWEIQKDPPGNFRNLNWTSNGDLFVTSFLDYWNVSANHVSRNLCTCTANFSTQQIRYGSVVARSTGHMLRVGSAVGRAVEHTVWCQAASVSDSVSHRAAKHKDHLPPLQNLSSLLQTIPTDTVCANTVMKKSKGENVYNGHCILLFCAYTTLH